jgi:hypothetical protein
MAGAAALHSILETAHSFATDAVASVHEAVAPGNRGPLANSLWYLDAFCTYLSAPLDLFQRR